MNRLRPLVPAKGGIQRRGSLLSRRGAASWKGIAAFAICCFVELVPALAQPIKNPIAIFNGLDKITGRITEFEVGIDQAKAFGALTVKPRVCNTRDVTERPKTTAFVEVDEKSLDGASKRIFTGWMFAESPGLNAVEHPIFDVWLTGCRDPNAPPVPKEEAPPEIDLDSEAVPQDTD